MRKRILIYLLVHLFIMSSYGQDPNFAQFYSSPLNINPALTASINSDWRLISNFRNQWIGPSSPYMTGTISYDRKIQKRTYKEEEGNRIGIGAMMMYDYTMSGIARNTYASLNLSYNVKLSEGDIINRIGVGFGAIYGKKYVDFSKLDFEEQWTGTLEGFNTNLPTGEDALVNMKGYISLTGGFLYSHSTDKSNFDMGVALFHINTPKQTYLKDDNQVLPMRKVIHANFETFLNENVILNTNAIYQKQSTATYYSVGMALGYYLGTDPDVIINGGLWYWSNNSITPYIGYQYNHLQLGLTYDVTVSKLRDAPRRANSFELSIILRGQKPTTDIIPCPWK